MSGKRIGSSTVQFKSPPSVLSASAIAGPREGKGPFGPWFDAVIPDELYGERTPEKAETRYMETAVRMALGKAGVMADDVQYLAAGDLQNQLTVSSRAAEQFNMPYIGLYGACSTTSLSLALGCLLIDGDYADRVVVATSSHYQSVERQFHYPLELGVQRKPGSQITVTGAGAAVLGISGGRIKVTHATLGRVLDLGISDPYEMGPAMAPAACDTLMRHFADTGRRPESYDLVLTGDLGFVGAVVLQELMATKGVPLKGPYSDCGQLIFGDDQSNRGGGSGCACSALMTYGWVVARMASGELNRALIVATGALMSSLSLQQGATIPGVAHAVSLEAMEV